MPALSALSTTMAVMLQAAPTAPAQDEPLFRKGDHVSLIGNGLAERMQHHGWLETILQARFPELELSFRNMGFSADELTVRQRTANFGSQDEYLTRTATDVVFAFFGFNESFAGPEGVPAFEAELAKFVDHVRSQKYDGENLARLVLFGSIPFENIRDPNVPDGQRHNTLLRAYNRAMKKVADAKGLRFVNPFRAMLAAYAAAPEPLTHDGIHLTEAGNEVFAQVLDRALFGPASGDPAVQGPVREIVRKKNLQWFNRYRATDGFNVYGGRSSLKYTDGLTNYTVLQRELEILDAMSAQDDRRIWARARGEEWIPTEGELPEPIDVPTNKKGPGPEGQHLFLGGAEAIARMTPAPGMKVNLFADEAMFPELVNPVQMAWDTRGRLWVATWPTYTHWRPDQEMNDRLIILEDTDGDGVADTCETFVDDLHNPTGFEFWNGGVIVANCPDLLFLKDTDGDGRCDHRERILHGLSSADTHHSANSFVLGQDGALYFQEGTFHQTQIESIYGPERCHNGCVWRYEPRTRRVERYIAYNFANPHGHVFDRWGQDFMTDGTGNVNYYSLPFSGRVVHPDKHRGYFPFFKQRSRPCAGTEILSSRHFPEENQGSYLICNVIGFQGLFQYRVVDDGSGFTAEELDPIVSSTDPNFRPADAECGPDGALYFLDWQNPLIGHMQHHIRDPSRDRKHGRVYRVSYPGRPLVEKPAIAGQPTSELVKLLASPENRTRYLVRIELSARDSDEVYEQVRLWARDLPEDAELEHRLLETLWVLQQHNRMDEDLLLRLLRAEDPRARAAATRVVRGMRHQLPFALKFLKQSAADPHPRVRLEALVAASSFDDPEAADVALEVLKQPMDKFLDYALAETMRTLEPFWKEGIREGRAIATDNPAGLEYLLGRVSEAELVKLPRTPAVLQALLTRHGVPRSEREAAATAMAEAEGRSVVDVLLSSIARTDEQAGGHAHHVLADLGVMLQDAMAAGASIPREAVLELATSAKSLPTRQMGLAALIRLDGDCEAAWELCRRDRGGIETYLGALPQVGEESLRAANYERVRPLMFHLPPQLRGADDELSAGSLGLNADYYPQRLTNAELDFFQTLTPAQTLRVDHFTLELPGVRPPDAFGVMYRGSIHVPTSGEYSFFTNSDDGSMLYLDDVLVVANNGSHAMREQSGKVSLQAGAHSIVVTFYDQAGGQGLVVSWAGPGLDKQPIPGSVLTTDDTRGLRGAAVRAMAHIPGNEEEKLQDAAKLIGEGLLLDPVVYLLERIPAASRPAAKVRPLISSIAAYASGLAPEMRTTPQVLAALNIGKEMARALPEAEAAAAQEQLSDLGGTTILMRTVPHQMLYDRVDIAVEAGKPAAIVFQNNDVMPHNLVITRPGSVEAVGEAAELLVGDRQAQDEGYIPDSDDVLWHTGLLFPGETEELRFVAPTEKGEYHFVCTFPGHWRVMNGILYVVDDLSEVQLAAVRTAGEETSSARRFVQMWNLEDLQPAVQGDWEREADVANGRHLFTDVGCIKCHLFEGAGVENAPDLTELGKKYGAEEVLRHLLEPSAEILEGFENQLIFTRDGSTVVGRVMEDDGETLHVVQDLQRPDEVTRVAKDQVDFMKNAKTSAMPTGLLVTMSAEEVRDLVAFLRSGVPADQRK